MKSIIVSLSGNTPTISIDLHPEIELDERFEYSCCLLDFSIRNTVFTYVMRGDNFVKYVDGDDVDRIARLNPGEQDVVTLFNLVQDLFKRYDCDTRFFFDPHEMKYRIKTTKPISMSLGVAQATGFDELAMDKNSTTVSSYRLGQFNAETIRVNCNLVDGSYHNGVRTHVIHEFTPKPVSDYKLIEQPQHLIYLPVIKQRINSVNITVTDQNGNLLHLKRGVIHCRLIIVRNCVTDQHSKC